MTAFCSPGTASAFAASIPGSTFLACRFATCTVAYKLVRPSAPLPVAVRPASGRLPASARRLLASAPDQPLLRPPLPFGVSTPLRIKAFCRFRCRSVRLPVAPDFLSLPAPVFLSLVGWKRINVPGSLRFRRLAVPQTSWNLHHYAPGKSLRQRNCHPIFTFSSTL